MVDVWDALISDRPYRKAFDRAHVIQHIRDEQGKSFDPQVVKVFIDLVEAGDIEVGNMESR